MRKNLLILTLCLLTLCAACEKQPLPAESLPPATEAVPPAGTEPQPRVRTDYSGLTPRTPRLKYTRLGDGPLPELVPSHGYGDLLPYIGATTSAPGYGGSVSTYGLVTADGMIVTDAVYNRIERVTTYDGYEVAEFPAYLLTRYPPSSEPGWDSVQAVCALDGSWITPFDYLYAMFNSDVMLLVRDYNSYDIDVYDYGGRFLYNMSRLPWISDASDDFWQLQYNGAEGYTHAIMRDGSIAFVDLMTGEPSYTEYTGAGQFSEGLVSVYKDGLWGFADKAFELVIPCEYEHAQSFRFGRAVVQLPGGLSRLIDKNGRTLLATDGTSYIEESWDGTGYVVYNYQSGVSEFYSHDLVRIPADVPEGYSHQQHGGGWFSVSTEDGVRLFSADEEYFFPDAASIGSVFGGGSYISYYTKEWHHGVMTLDGDVIIPPIENASIAEVSDGSAVKAFIVARYNPDSGYYAMGSPGCCSLYDTDGRLILSVNGVLSYVGGAGLYALQEDDRYSYLDMEGKPVFSVPLMSYALD